MTEEEKAEREKLGKELERLKVVNRRLSMKLRNLREGILAVAERAKDREEE